MNLKKEQVHEKKTKNLILTVFNITEGHTLKFPDF